MKKIMTLAIIALASVAMVACCGQQKPKTEEAPACTATECTECPKKAECPKAVVEEAQACPATDCAECPKKAECPKAK